MSPALTKFLTFVLRAEFSATVSVGLEKPIYLELTKEMLHMPQPEAGLPLQNKIHINKHFVHLKLVNTNRAL